MLEEEKNLKDSIKDIKSMSAPYEAESFHLESVTLSYTKTSKLIMGLFMVTDIMDKEEPLRTKLRILGTEIISDTYSAPLKAGSKISEVMSFLDIASAINLISVMNSSILKNEFIKLEQSIKEYGQIGSTWLEDFSPRSQKQESIGHGQSFKTRQTRTRIGVQKGSTLMKALSKVGVSYRVSSNLSKNINNFDLLKKQRREDIISILKKNEEGFTITDIKTKSKGPDTQSQALISCSEKTLQRELASMIVEGILLKTGEKRWSRYFLSQ